MLIAKFASNNAIHALTGLSPFYAMYGYNLDIHLESRGELYKEGVPEARQHA